MKDSIKTILIVIALLIIGYLLLPYVKLDKKDEGAQTPSGNETVSGTQIYNSDNLGASFSYNPDQDGDGKADTAVTETGDKAYVYFSASAPEQGQWVQKFSKDPKDTLEQAVTKQFLANTPSKDCTAKDMGEFYKQYGAVAPAGAENIKRVLIVYPIPEEPDQFFANESKCPQGYSLTNGLNYFYMDTNHPERYYFFSIGQYAIASSEARDKAWQDTFEVK